MELIGEDEESKIQKLIGNIRQTQDRLATDYEKRKGDLQRQLDSS